VSTPWSIDAVIASLEKQAAFYREREAFHAGHEAHHREKREGYAKELGEIERRLEAFRAAAGEAIELASRQAPTAPAEKVKQADLGSASRPKLGRRVETILREKAATDLFGPVGLAREVNHHFAERLRRPVTDGQVSVVLRRLHRQGKIHQTRPGRPHWEALYAKEAPAG
jgi:hypothetical protein